MTYRGPSRKPGDASTLEGDVLDMARPATSSVDHRIDESGMVHLYWTGAMAA